MKVYVDELPKSCSYCPCKCFETDTCQLNKGIKCPSDNKIANKCPLQSLADYTKQVRKEVCEEIRDLAGNYFELPICYNCGEASNDDVVLTGNDLTEILDQIQGE